MIICNSSHCHGSQHDIANTLRFRFIAHNLYREATLYLFNTDKNVIRVFYISVAQFYIIIYRKFDWKAYKESMIFITRSTLGFHKNLHKFNKVTASHECNLVFVFRMQFGNRIWVIYNYERDGNLRRQITICDRRFSRRFTRLVHFSKCLAGFWHVTSHSK